MNRQSLEKIKKMLCDELEDISKRDLTSANLDLTHKMTDTIKNIDKIMNLEYGDYSNDGDWEARGSYGNYPGRHRDAMGRYARTGGRDRMRSQLESMMYNEELSGAERSALKRAMDTLDNY